MDGSVPGIRCHSVGAHKQNRLFWEYLQKAKSHSCGLMERPTGGNHHQIVKREQTHSTRGLSAPPPPQLQPKPASALTPHTRIRPSLPGEN